MFGQHLRWLAPAGTTVAAHAMVLILHVGSRAYPGKCQVWFFLEYSMPLACDTDGKEEAEQQPSGLKLQSAPAVEGPRQNRAAVVACDGWGDWLLELLLDGSPCLPASQQQQVDLVYAGPTSHPLE